VENLQGTRHINDVRKLSLFTKIYFHAKKFLRKLRRCGKKMPRFCDVNNDKKITLSEWLNCLQTQRIQNEQQPSSTNISNNNNNNFQKNERPMPQTQAKTKLNGKNPLEFILKAD
jgi:SPARC-related modular calcium-binding protein